MELRTDFIDTSKIKNFGDEWRKAWHHNDKIKRINRGISLKGLGQFLLDRGFTHITVEYEGSGDSGDTYLSEGFMSKKDFDGRSGQYSNGEQCSNYGPDPQEGTRYQKKLQELYKTYKEYNTESQFGRDDDELHYVLSSIIGYDWYNNDGGRGELIWDLKKEKIFIEGEQYYQGSVECSETYFLDGSEPKTKYRDHD